MKILWFTWKDQKNSRSGGAELVATELAKRFVSDGHEVTFMTSKEKGLDFKEKQNDYKIIRVGNKFSVYWKAFRYYKNNLNGQFDLVIDELNTVPFFTKFYTKEKSFLFVHQLARKVWFYQAIFPFSLIGYLLEPFYLKLIKNSKVITISNSTKKDLEKIGFRKENIEIISEGIDMDLMDDVSNIEKYNNPTILCLGSIRSMKRVDHVIKSFEIAKETKKDLNLIIAGEKVGNYGKKVINTINSSKYKDSIHYLGKVNKDKKKEILQKSHLLCVTSVKEGWCLTVTEANSQGTPALVYDVDGLRDSVKNNKTGLITDKNNPKELSKKIIYFFNSKKDTDRLRLNAWRWSKEITFDRSYKELETFLKNNI